jgi:hypothetical protein
MLPPTGAEISCGKRPSRPLRGIFRISPGEMQLLPRRLIAKMEQQCKTSDETTGSASSAPPLPFGARNRFPPLIAHPADSYLGERQDAR